MTSNVPAVNVAPTVNPSGNIFTCICCDDDRTPSPPVTEKIK